MKLPPFPQFCRDVLGRDIATRQAGYAFFAALDGEPLDPVARALVERYTGRRYAAGRKHWQGILQVGREGGKTEMVADRETYKATAAALAGRRARFAAVAQDHRAARMALFSRLRQNFNTPLLAPLVTRVTADTIELADGRVTIFVFPCRPTAWRGLADVDEFFMDEIAHYRTSENLPLDRECWRSALPTLAMTGGKLIAASSPYAASGLLFDLHEKYYGNSTSDLLYWVSPSTVLNPKLNAAFLQHLRDVDPEGAQAEIDGEFLRHVSTLVDDDVIRAAVDQGVVVRPPAPDVRSEGCADVATGTRDGCNWTAASASLRAGQAVLDAVLVIRPPFSPESAARETAEFLRRYGCTRVWCDNFAHGFSNEAFQRAGLSVQPLPLSKSDLYLALSAALNSGRVRLLDHPELLKELRGLERRRGPVKDKVDHRRGTTDDAINSAAAALYLAGLGRLHDPAFTRACLTAGAGPSPWRNAPFATAGLGQRGAQVDDDD